MADIESGANLQDERLWLKTISRSMASKTLSLPTKIVRQQLYALHVTRSHFWDLESNLTIRAKLWLPRACCSRISVWALVIRFFKRTPKDFIDMDPYSTDCRLTTAKSFCAESALLLRQTSHQSSLPLHVLWPADVWCLSHPNHLCIHYVFVYASCLISSRISATKGSLALDSFAWEICNVC